MVKKAAACVLSLVMTLALAACAQSSKNFDEATGIDLAAARITLAEYGASGSTGDAPTFFLSAETLDEILSSVRLERGRKRDSMPERFFFFHITLANEETTELVVGCDGEIIVGKPDARSFWTDPEGLAYQQLLREMEPTADAEALDGVIVEYDPTALNMADLDALGAKYGFTAVKNYGRDDLFSAYFDKPLTMGETVWLMSALSEEPGIRCFLRAEQDRKSGLPLTGEELDAWRETLRSEDNVLDEETGVYYVKASIASCFFTSCYSDPRDLNLENFLDYCPLGTIIGYADGSLTEAEHEAIVAALNGADPGRAVATRRYLVSDINAALAQYAGITLDDMSTDWRNDERMLYLPEYDAFYNFTSDWGPGRFEPVYGECDGNVVTLWDSCCVLTLRLTDDGYHILSCLPIDAE